MANTQKVEVSKETLKSTEELWTKFTFFTKIGVISMFVFLGLMALFLV